MLNFLPSGALVGILWAGCSCPLFIPIPEGPGGPASPDGPVDGGPPGDDGGAPGGGKIGNGEESGEARGGGEGGWLNDIMELEVRGEEWL